MRKKIISILLLAIVLSSCTQEKISKEDDVVDIVWYVLGSEQKDEKIVEDEINKRLEKEIGVRLHLRMIDANEYAEKMRFNFSVFRGVALLRFPIFTKTLEIYLYISARV